ncbi:hypothetical protein [Paenibacillus sp. Root444D2]|uniref:hypothetical protein n=1 Tax=Paenibacillus sp. Root444D2 TaxID=1736538 RepID=UPI000A8F6F06|nr:hypothetical protein [Paenibacillus sp. Root444D2]
MTVVSMSVYPLANTWRDESTSGTIPQKVVMDKPKLEIYFYFTKHVSAYYSGMRKALFALI